ncbi:MAG: hypothetical protein H0V10_00350 [Geodermatophilaceae bacterium]|nr:hypothetical protein [Geodermatophilaceae bacterium]
MDYRITAAERASYKRCRRLWDFGSSHRRNLEPVQTPPVDVAAAIRDALAVYYYPGMWDWQSGIVLPLVRKAFMRSIAGQPSSPQRTVNVDVGTALLERYLEWAPSLDDFGPIRIDHEVEALVPHPGEPGRGLHLPDGRRIVYTDRVDLLAIDVYDVYWVVRHQVVTAWQDIRSLLLDEESVAACWAWEDTYIGMDVAGTIHNEILIGADYGAPPAGTLTGRAGRGGYPQHEGSGGGRNVAQHQRQYGRPPEPEGVGRVEQQTSGMIRRTRIRRTREEIAGMGTLIAAEALEMLDPAVAVYPSPGAHCTACAFDVPCLTISEGEDPALDLAARYRTRPVGLPPKARLGATGGSRGGVVPPGS